MKFQQLRSRQGDLFREDISFKIREDCSKNRGVFNFGFKRCYFIIRHPAPGLNFTEQAIACDRQGAILSYPRTFDEIAYLWEFFETNQRSTFSLESIYNSWLHVGFIRQKPVTTRFPQFKSIDGLVNVNSEKNVELFRDNYGFR